MYLDKIVEICRENNCLVRVNGKEPRVVIAGQTNDITNQSADLLVQEKILEIMQPNTILHPLFYEGAPERDDYIRVRTWGETYGASMAKAGLPQKNEENHLLGREGLWKEITPVLQILVGSSALDTDYIRMFEQEYMARQIIQGVEGGQAPLFLAAYAEDVLPSSRIHQQLEQSKTSYVLIAQDEVFVQKQLEGYNNFFSD